MEWVVLTTEEFDAWFEQLTETQKKRIAVKIDMLELRGPTLRHPDSSDIAGSRHGGMRELRIQIGGAPFRVLYAFDPNRAAVLLLGGDKTGDERWFEVNVPKADLLFDRHLASLEPKEGSRKKGKGNG